MSFFMYIFFKRNEESYHDIEFNVIDTKYNCDRRSHHGQYRLVEFKHCAASTEKEIKNDKYLNNAPLVPLNPVGRTGL